MFDIIQLLPDSVANQIAAGEVIQRPASAVKEMLENAVDAGASKIQLITKDSGKTLIQIIDNGIGMSETDARLSFERHATSKIRKADDLFTLHTMGFRGEALASIAAIAQVEMKTRLLKNDVGTHIQIEGSVCQSQEPCATPVGTSIAIKNLFYNVPARRSFLKSNQVETRHIVEEFTRVALANPSISFSFHQNELQLFDVREGNFRQRISTLFGNNYNERLVPVEEETTIVNLDGFIGKPEFAKKNRGEQYLFVNNRFIKDNYLNHAITSAFESLIARDSYPSYWLRLTIDPSQIDVNIHPTKTEIKFIDDKSVYAIVRAAVKRALGRFSITPSLDFDQERAFDIPLDKMGTIPLQPSIRINPNYNPFANADSNTVSTKRFVPDNATQVEQWTKLQDQLFNKEATANLEIKDDVSTLHQLIEDLHDDRFIQIGLRVMCVSFHSGLLLVDIPAAQERILFEHHLHAFENKSSPTQQQLFPPHLNLSESDTQLLLELRDDLLHLGFDIADFGNNTLVVQGIPTNMEPGNERQVLETLVEQYRNNRDRFKLSNHENLARSLAKGEMIKSNRQFQQKELRQIALNLLQCEQPNYSINGKKIIRKFSSEDLLNLIN